MDSSIGISQKQPVLVWNRELDRFNQGSASPNGGDTAREAIALFPAGRFFPFPVRVRIQIACESHEGQPLCGSAAEDHDPAGDALADEVGRAVLGSLENANCADMGDSTSALFLFGDLTVDFRKMELRRSGERVEVTAHEFKVLRYFLARPEAAISRDELLNQVWGFHAYPTTRTVDNTVLRLRKKLEQDPSRPAHFLTVRGVGYKFVP